MAIGPAVLPIRTDTSGTSRRALRMYRRKRYNAELQSKLIQGEKARITVMAVTPMLAYEEGVAALEWLSKAFGFREVNRMTGNDGRLAHGEMDTGDGVIMMATPSPD